MGVGSALSTDAESPRADVGPSDNGGKRFRRLLPADHSCVRLGRSSRRLPVSKVLHSLLVIDDDALVGRALARLLRRYRVDVAFESRRALDAVERNTYDAFLVDVCLGEADPRGGLGLACQLRKLRPRAAILLLSAFGADEMTAQAVRVGADAFLQKGGLGTSELTRVLEAALLRRTAQEPTEVDAASAGGLQPLIDAVLEANDDEVVAGALRICRLIRLAHAASATSSRARAAAAAAVGLARPTLHGYARVAACWSESEIENLLCVRRTTVGEFLSVSHLVEVAKVGRRAQRADLVESILSRSLTVADVARMVAGLEEQGGRTSAPRLKG
jgi:DNA-binding response OmpR family regulator